MVLIFPRFFCLKVLRYEKNIVTLHVEKAKNGLERIKLALERILNIIIKAKWTRIGQ